jgi:HEAT repeat protein
MFGGVVAAGALAGCGKDKEPDHEPPPAVAQNTTNKLVAPVDPPKADPKPEPEPKAEPPKTEPKKKDPVNAVPPPFYVPPPPPPLIPTQPLPMPPMPVPKDSPLAGPAKEAPKDPNKPYEWPTSVLGRPLSEYIKDIDDPDPAIREQGLRTVPAFGPDARKPAVKAVLRRMSGQNEKDPGVRAAAFEAIGAFALFSENGIVETEADTSEALRILLNVASHNDTRGQASRLHAITTIGNFGPRGLSSIDTLVSTALTKDEPSYDTRRALANTLGAISFIKDHGPSPRSINALLDMIHDPSAAVRLGAYQSIVLLGPVYLPVPKDAPPKTLPKVDEKTVAAHVKAIKVRLAPFKPMPGSKTQNTATGLVEPDKQVEIFARLALMRLDLKEQTDENLGGIAKYITQPGESGPKLMALNAFVVMGPGGAKRIGDVLAALDDEDPQVVVAATTALVAMGPEAKPALEVLEKMKLRGKTKEEKEQYALLADRAIKAIQNAIKEAKQPPKS